MNSKPIYLIATLWLLCLCGSVQGQYYNSKKYTIENSAAEGSILQVQQDGNGAIWWVNDENFTRYNGIVYQSISYGKLAATYQHVLPYVDENGELWLCLATEKKNDIYRRINNEWTKVSSLVMDLGEGPSFFYATIINDKPWATIALQTRVMVLENGEWGELPLDTDARIKRVEAKGDAVYIVSAAGIYLAKYGRPPFKLELPAEIATQIIDVNLFNNPLKSSPEPELWMLTDNVVGYISKNTLTVVKLFDNSLYHFTKLRCDGTGKVYLLDDVNKLWQYDTKETSFIPLEDIGAALNENINQLFTDRENNLWLATEDGLIKTTSQSINFISKQKGLGSLPVHAVAVWGDKILAAGPKGLSVVADNKVTNYYPYTEPELINPRQRITQLWADSNGYVWLLSNTQGLWYSPGGKNWTKVQGNAHLLTFAVVPDGRILAASEAGLFEAIPSGLKLINTFPDKIVPNRLVWHNNALLILSDKGIYKLSNNKWQKLTKEGHAEFSLPSYAMFRVYDNLAILGTEKGIYYLKEFDLVKYETDTLWANKPYYGISVDKNGAVWLASDTGIVVMDKKGAPKIFTYHGFQFKENAGSLMVTGSKGGVWVAMRAGLMVYQPDYDKQVVRKPSMYISRFESREVAAALLLPNATLKLASEDNDITFYFDANSFIDEDKNKLLYKLDGYMTGWEELTNPSTNSISFKNLPPGKYVLKMQLINAGGIASDIASSPVININKPFYNQWWFYAAVIAAFFGLSFAVFYLYSQKKFENDLILEVDKRSRELRSSEARFRSLWENTSDALALYNLRGDIILYNDTFLQFLGRNDNIAGRKIFDVLEISQSDMTKESFRQSLELQQLSPQFEILTRKNEEEIVLEFSNTYIQLPNEKSWVMLSLIRNITQRKQTEENLIQAKNEAEQASRVKSAFLATMSHEIRTPLNAIIGMSSVIRNTTLNDEQQNYVNAIKTSSDSLLSLVNNILDFSKIEAGMMMIEKGEASPEEIITETMDILGNLANQKGIYLYSRIHPDTPVKIESDKTRLRQVLINLVGNAIKFTEKGHVEIAIRPDENNQLKISVTDTGIGIPRQKINDLFKVFTQVDNTTTRKYGGTGLGLAITDKLVSLLGGSIKIASQEGKGSQFTFTIQDFSNGKTPITRSSLLRKFSGVRTVLVSPEKAVANIFRSLNDERGIRTTVVPTLADAAPLAEDASIILLDVDNIAPAEFPAQLKGKEVIIIKQRQQKIPAEILDAIEPDKLRNITLPVSSVAYQKVLDKIIKPKKSAKPHIITETPTAPKTEVLPIKMLVVDDNKVNLMMMEVILRNLGYKPDFANNGREAVEKCLAHTYDLVFMDVQMPEMDGIQATSIIKSKILENAPAIVALTANAFPEDKQACLDAGMIDFLPKPVTLDTIKNLLTKQFGNIFLTADQ